MNKFSKKFIGVLIAITIVMGANVAISGLPPTTLQGFYESVKFTTFNFFAPNRQGTLVAGGTLIETGNTNLLINPSFEHRTATTGWTNFGGTLVLDTSIEVDGKQALDYQSTASTIELSQDSTLYASQFADGVQGIASAWVKTSVSGIFVCPRLAGVTVAQASCVPVRTDNKWALYTVPFILGATSNGIAVTSYGAAVTGSIKVDNLFVGTWSGNVFPGNNNDTSWVSCGLTGANVTGFGTSVPAPTLRCKRQGGDLLIRGNFQAGTTPTAIEARVSLPVWNGVQLVSKDSSQLNALETVGYFTRGSVDASHGGAVFVEPSVTYLTFSTSQTFSGTASSSIVKGNGNAILITGETAAVTARVPIAGWDDTNYIIGTFKEVVTSKGTDSPDIQSVYFGGNATCSAACTTGTCTICSQVGNRITSVTFASTGNYNLNGIDGTKYNCSGSGYNGSFVTGFHDRPSSTTSFARIGMGVAAVGANAGWVSVICHGRD